MICLTCLNRHWLSNNFTILTCQVKKLRFGLQSDIERGFVNKDGGCVKMPETCKEYRK